MYPRAAQEQSATFNILNPVDIKEHISTFRKRLHKSDLQM